MKITELSKNDYEYYELHYTYEANECYTTITFDEANKMSVEFKRIKLQKTFKRSTYDTLFQDTWFNPSAYGIFVEDSEKPVAILEIDREEWNNRIRITQLLVLEKYRAKGFGKLLIEKAKQIVVEEDYRLIVLETQNCNVNAIDFYRSQGFVFAGTNLFFYSNDDIGENEVMIEMVYLF